MAKCYMRFPGGLSKALTLSYDDGVEQDEQLIKILNEYNIKATFNINGGCFAPEGTVYPEGRIHRRLTVSRALELYKKPHEVALHSYTHPFLETLPTSQIAMEVLEDKRALEKYFGGVIRGMAYPMGTYSDDVVSVLKNAGVAYSRTIQSTEKFDIPRDWLRMPATCHHNNPRLLELAETFVSKEYNRHPQLFYLWGHSYEFEDHKNWHVIEDFCKTVANKDDIWYATNIEIYDYITAYNRLSWAIDMKAVYNPSAVSVWVKVAKPFEPEQTVEIKPGETLTL